MRLNGGGTLGGQREQERKEQQPHFGSQRVDVMVINNIPTTKNLKPNLYLLQNPENFKKHNLRCL